MQLYFLIFNKITTQLPKTFYMFESRRFSIESDKELRLF